jgi:hypothetical protein
MKRTLKKRINKRTLKKRKNIRKTGTRRRGGMFASRVSQSILRHAEPHIERKAKEWGTDILEAKIKKSDIYKDTNKKLEEGFNKTLTKGAEIFNDENVNPNINKMPTTGLAIPPNLLSTIYQMPKKSSNIFYKNISHPLSNTYNIKQNI